MSNDWNTLNPMANEGERLGKLEQRFDDHMNDYRDFKGEMKQDVKAIQMTIWKAIGALGMVIFIAQLLFNVHK